MITIIYDGECPLCDNYIRRLRLVKTFGAIEIVDARAEPQKTKEYWERGYDLDEGMIVVIDEAVYYGAEAATMLARLSTNSAFLGKIHRWTLSQAAVSKLAYPVMKACRRIALRMIGRTGLANPISSADPPHK